MSEDLKRSINELNKTVKRLNRRFSPWKVIWFGSLQGVGAVIGATVFVFIIGYILDILGLLPFVGELAIKMKALFVR